MVMQLYGKDKEIKNVEKLSRFQETWIQNLPKATM